MLLRKASPLVVALGAGLLASCGNGDHASGPGQAAGAGQPAPSVSTEIVVEQRVELKTRLPGRVVASRVSEVRPQVSGLIVERLFNEGDRVEAGAPLYQIEEDSFRVAHERAKASLVQSRAAAATATSLKDRYAGLVQSGGVSQQEYDDAVAAAEQARAGVLLAQADLNDAKIALDRARIKAPIAGFVGRSLVTEGALVTANQATPLTTVTALDPIYVDVTESADDVLKWKRRFAAGKFETVEDGKLPVTLEFSDGSTYEHQGHLTLAEVNVDPSAGVVTLRAVFPNPDELLLPGMFVRAEIVEGIDPGGILVPQASISRGQDGQGRIFTVADDGTAAAQTVVTERAIGNQWLVSGLEPGTRIVTAGQSSLQPGMAVRIEERVTSNSAAATAETDGVVRAQ